MRFSANTGFLYRDLPLPDAIRAAKAAGFDAVEFHDEAQRSDLGAVAEALAETGLPLCGLNTFMGATAGRAAMPGEETEFARDIEKATSVADRLGARAIHVVAGRVTGIEARKTYIATLRRAVEMTDRTLLIEPICRKAMPDYHLSRIDDAVEVIEAVGSPQLKLMFDCYHVETETGGSLSSFRKYINLVGHVQIASVPERSDPDEGELDYGEWLSEARAAGYEGAIGCEFVPRKPLKSTIANLRSIVKASS